MLQLLHEVRLQRSAQRSDCDQPDALAPQRVNRRVLLFLRQNRAHRVAGDVAFRAQRLHRRRNLRALPNHLHFALHRRGQILHRAHAAQFALVNDRDPVAQRLGVGKNVRREKYRLAFVLQLLHQVANFAPPQRIQSRHRLVEENQLRIVQNGLRDSRPLQHSLRELAQLHALYVGQAHPLQHFVHPPLAVFAGTPDSCP